MPVLRSAVHGNAFMAEEEGGWYIERKNSEQSLFTTKIVEESLGFAKIFRAKASHKNWIHVAIPTISFAFDTNDFPNLHLQNAFVFFDAVKGCLIRSIHMWDGIKPILIQDLNITGKHTDSKEPDINVFRPSIDHLMEGGLGISLYIEFPNDESHIWLYSAGAEFNLKLDQILKKV